MNTLEIERVITQDPCGEAVFADVFARDQLPATIDYPCAMVWNTDPSNEAGEHWVAMYVDEWGHGEYFDSYGLPPPSSFEHYLNRHCVQWIRNTVQLQDLLSTACGQFCVYFVMYRSHGMPMNDIVEHLKNTEHNDDYVMDVVNGML